MKLYVIWNIINVLKYWVLENGYNLIINIYDIYLVVLDSLNLIYLLVVIIFVEK